MDHSERQLEARFHQAMLDIYDEATRLKPPYRPTDFRRMVTDLGGRETANRLLASGNPSSGFPELYIRGKENLRLSVEYLVPQSPWRGLFRSEQLEIARHRLVEVGCEPPEPDEPRELNEWRSPEEVIGSEAFVEGRPVKSS